MGSVSQAGDSFFSDSTTIRMKFHILITCAVICSALGGETKPPIIHVEQGALQGAYLTSRGGRQFFGFQGIPYAQPPVGSLRFKDPEPPKPWKGIWNATVPGSMCLQYNRVNPPMQHLRDPVMGDEDCLFINVYTPKLPAKGEELNLDVIFNIHCGAFMYGWGHEYGPEILLDRDVIYASINYRLGPLGFLTTEDDVVPGNMGLKDQNAALKWVRKNIKQFGGNPDSVTITGTSAGGASVHYHILSPMSKGLFARGISQSGNALSPWPQMEAGRKKANKLGALVGCPSDCSRELVECLRSRPARQIARQIREFMVWQYNPFSPFAPTVEKAGPNPFLIKNPIDALLDQDFNNVPWMESVTTEDGLYPVADWVSSEEVMNELKERFAELAPHIFDYNYTVSEQKKPEVLNKILQHYLQGRPVSEETVPELIQMVGDRVFVVDAVRAAKIQATLSSAPVYFYLFGYRGKHSFSEIMSGKTTNFGASHLDDTGYVTVIEFKTDEAEEDIQMSKTMVDIWTSFAKSGNPVPSGGSFIWNPVARNSKNLDYLFIKGPKDLTMAQSDNHGQQKFWDSLPINEKQIGKTTPLTAKASDEL